MFNAAGGKKHRQVRRSDSKNHRSSTNSRCHLANTWGGNRWRCPGKSGKTSRWSCLCSAAQRGSQESCLWSGPGVWSVPYLTPGSAGTGLSPPPPSPWGISASPVYPLAWCDCLRCLFSSWVVGRNLNPYSSAGRRKIHKQIICWSAKMSMEGERVQAEDALISLIRAPGFSRENSHHICRAFLNWLSELCKRAHSNSSVCSFTCLHCPQLTLLCVFGWGFWWKKWSFITFFLNPLCCRHTHTHTQRQRSEVQEVTKYFSQDTKTLKNESQRLMATHAGLESLIWNSLCCRKGRWSVYKFQ